jgi:hypothetical protein
MSHVRVPWSDLHRALLQVDTSPGKRAAGDGVELIFGTGTWDAHLATKEGLFSASAATFSGRGGERADSRQRPAFHLLFRTAGEHQNAC